MSDRTDAVTLHQWAVDAQNAYNNWVAGATYTVAKDNVIRETVRRLGVLAEHLANQLEHNSFAD